MANRDWLSVRLQLGHVLSRLVVDRQLVLVGEEHDAGCCELLRDRGDVEHRRGRERHAQLEVRSAIGMLVDDGSALADAAAWGVRPVPLRNQHIDVFGR
jgi:hypothetical protein